MIGSRLGPYEITAKLGEGGMGEVYRAADSRLEREVAIKVLPAAFTADKERLARFEREAKLLAQLHHPNIASIFGLEEADGIRALVMELVEGEELSARIGRAALPLDEALPIALQIAEALEAAHERGIVHRDLKPANIKLRADGTVKVLDFGLAKALDPVSGGASEADLARSPTQAHSPTLTAAHVTEGGVILGTAAYMAPEQARGSAVDKRADIWAFGVVLHEMLTGRSLFAGPTVSDTLASVLRTEIDWSALPAATSPPIRALLRRCLERNPRNRLHDIADARLVLGDALAGRTEPGETGAAIAAPVRRGALWWSWLGGFCLGAAIVALVAFAVRAAAPTARHEVLRFGISAASGAAVNGGAGNSAISPNGRRVVFVGNDTDGRQGLWVQELDQIPARLLAGTEDASYPFWAPDSQRVAFFARGMLNRVSLVDGRVDGICEALEGRGGSWGRAGTIVFAPTSTGGLAAVAEAGGVPRSVTRIETPEQEISHRYPSFLPDGRRFVYIADPGAGTDEGRVFLASTDGAPRRLLYRSNRAPVYAAPGYLIDAIDDRVVARRFDPKSTEVGEAVRLTEATPTYVHTQDRVASASESGTLLVPSAESQRRKLSWLDRRGRRLGEVPLPRGPFDMARISPDGRSVAIVARGVKNTDWDLWVVDLATEQARRLTFAAGSETYPVWAPDGASVVFQTNRRGPNDLWLQPASGGGVEQALYESAVAWKVPSSWVGDTLVFESQDAATGFDVWLLRPVRPGVAPVPLLRSAASETSAAISPDGNWLAYSSNQSGRREIYVVSLPDARVKYQVTTEGGAYPLWTQGGRELIYLTTGDSLAAISVALGDSLAFGPSVTLFSRPRSNWGRGFDLGLDVSPDGSRFVLVEPASDSAHSLIVVTHWLADLKAESGR